jgi:hypothetical protein
MSFRKRFTNVSATGASMPTEQTEQTDIVERLRERADRKWPKDGDRANSLFGLAADTIVSLRAENEALRAELRFARDEVEDWGGYASEYFRTKHDLAGTLARLDAALKDHP